MDRECEEIANLWIRLNPHCQIHGCEIDPAGSVIIRVLYRRQGSWQPLELNIGNPPKAVIRCLKKAIVEIGRAKRLTGITQSSIVQDSETGGNREHGGIEGRDK